MDAAQLNTLFELARTSRDAAATRLARLEQQVQQAREHLQTLVGYSDEYAARLQTQAGDQLDPASQSNKRAFLAKLRLARAARHEQRHTDEAAQRTASSQLASAAGSHSTNDLHRL